MKFLIYFFVIFLFFSINVNAANLNSCSIKTNCSPSEISLFKVDGTENAHAELNSQTVYSYFVCCGGSSLSNIPGTNSYNLLNLSDPTNAHVSYDGTYNQNSVYLGTTDASSISCNYNSVSNCNSNNSEVCIVTISGINNAHVADCSSPNAYQTKVCCNIASNPPTSCKLIKSYWENSTYIYQPGNNLEYNNELVSGVLLGENCDGQQVQFSISESDCQPSDDISIIPSGSSACNNAGILNPVGTPQTIQFIGNSARMYWTTTYQSDAAGDGDPPEFYFVANLISTTQSNLSQELRVQSSSPPPGGGGGSTCGDGTISGSEVCEISPNRGCLAGFNCKFCNSCEKLSGNTITTTTPCMDDGNGDKFGTRTENITNYDRTLNPGQPGYVISSSLVTKTCLLTGSLKVPFFGWINALVVIVLLTIFYLVRHKKNK